MAEKKETKKVNELVYIQSHLKAPKDKFNKFGGYAYRSQEAILEAVKPLLKEMDCTLLVSDEVVMVGDRVYIKATATLTTSSGTEYKTTAFAREPLSKKGIDESQVTGSTSSYARKYALNGLFCIDDNKDADALNTSKEYTQPATTNPAQPDIQQVMAEITACQTTGQLKEIWNKYTHLHTDAQFTGSMTARKDQILNNGKS